MVFLTLRLLLRKKQMVPYADRIWKKQMYLRLAWHFKGRKRNCYRLSRTPINRALRFATTGRYYRRRAYNYIFAYRIAAGCGQHGIQYSSFMKSLYESNIALNKKMLALLAMYEPRTFQSLCEFVKKKHSESLQQGLATALKPTPSGVITRDMITRVAKE